MKSFKSDIISLVEGKKILDLGCGVGNLLSRGAKGSVGVDCDRETIKKQGSLAGMSYMENYLM